MDRPRHLTGWVFDKIFRFGNMKIEAFLYRAQNLAQTNIQLREINKTLICHEFKSKIRNRNGQKSPQFTCCLICCRQFCGSKTFCTKSGSRTRFSSGSCLSDLISKNLRIFFVIFIPSKVDTRFLLGRSYYIRIGYCHIILFQQKKGSFRKFR